MTVIYTQRKGQEPQQKQGGKQDGKTRVDGKNYPEYYNLTDEKEEHMYIVGSVGRNTAISGNSDLDILFDLPESVYKKYDDYEGNGQSALLQDVKKVLKEKYPNKNIWVWSGFLFDRDLKDKEVLKYIDDLVDGQYKDELHNPKLKYCGSENQRVIDVKKSLLKNEVVLLEGELVRA